MRRPFVVSVSSRPSRCGARARCTRGSRCSCTGAPARRGAEALRGERLVEAFALRSASVHSAHFIDTPQTIPAR